MRLGVNGHLPYKDPDEWIRLVLDLDVGAVTAPMAHTDPPEVKKAYMDHVRRYGLVIGEVGIWKNPIAPDPAERAAAIEYSKARLALADEIGANCCVNVAGAAGPEWAGYYPENYSDDTYALLIDTIRGIIDAVRPRRTFYTVEPMQWMHPDSPDDCLQLMRDIDRRAVGVHLDCANMINGIERYRNRAAFVEECFRKLGAHVKSIHAKDVALGPESPCCLREVEPGKGGMDFAQTLRLAHGLSPDMPVFVEHLPDLDTYRRAVGHLRRTAADNGIGENRPTRG